MLNDKEQKTLMDVATSSVKSGIQTGKPRKIVTSEYSHKLRSPGACFVTLKMHSQLRGCIGSLTAWRPLVEDCADNAFAAATRDPRFPPVGCDEYEQLRFHISILSSTSPLHFSSEADLLRQLRPGTDGLVLEEDGHKGTFLPAVWDELPSPQEFLNHLKQKAGLPASYWSDTLEVSRYTVDDIYQES